MDFTTELGHIVTLITGGFEVKYSYLLQSVSVSVHIFNAIVLSGPLVQPDLGDE